MYIPTTDVTSPSSRANDGNREYSLDCMTRWRKIKQQEKEDGRVVIQGSVSAEPTIKESGVITTWGHGPTRDRYQSIPTQHLTPIDITYWYRPL